MISSALLLADLKRRLALLESDLRAQSEDPDVEWSVQLREEHERATQRGRTALTWSAWRDGEVSQAAVAWIIASTFVRFCEDNHLLDGHPAAGRSPVWLAGPDDRTARAVEHQQAHYEQHPTDNSRDWLLVAFRALADLPAGRGLVDPDHNPVWRAPISAPAADALLAFWRERADDGSLARDFTDPDLGTRFLGDLYQDLSEYAKKTYALLQTPVFVEEFILDRTLTPAIEEFGLPGLKLIDPTCGSGHFLLGAFARLDAAWRVRAPNLDARERVQKALDSIHGVDLNPFAVAIARFRLTVAALRASGDTTLTAAPEYRYHLAIGDSLLGEHGAVDTGALFLDDETGFAYASEDIGDYRGILTPGRYHVVAGNPPYIQVKDSALSELYRKAYPTCSGKYALSVPFMELFFRLARREGPEGGAGFVGKITSNSFMKREFGKKLIEKYLSGSDIGGTQSNPVDLLAVIDTSGAYIPGHGTPTVILVGRPRRPSGLTVKAALGIRGEPGQPADPAQGLVWSEITTHIDEDSYDGTYVTITSLDRDILSTHPWSLSGGGAGNLKEQIDSVGVRTPAEMALRIGVFGIMGADDAFMVTPDSARRSDDGSSAYRPLVVGDQVRDFAVQSSDPTFFPYSGGHNLLPLESFPAVARRMWAVRTELGNRVTFSKRTYFAEGRPWYEWHQLPKDIGAHRWAITLAFVATHNHFVLDRGGKVFKQSAPVIKLPASATESDHLSLLAILNTSTACFWLKQVSHDKGNGGIGGGIADQEWERFFEFTGTKLQNFPLPLRDATDRGRLLDKLAQQLAATAPTAALQPFVTDASISDGDATHAAEGRGPVAGSAGIGATQEPLGATGRRPSAALGTAHVESDHTRARMIFEQEELDWDAYALYGLVSTDLTYEGDLDTLTLGERAFEIALARQIESGAEESAWFDRHGSTPITTLPTEWPADYRDVVERRLAEMESNSHIRLLERPEYKRRWATTSWDAQQTEALRTVALDRLERADLWRDAHGAATLSVAQIADRTRDDEVLRSVLELLAGSAQLDVVQTLTALLKDEAVPFLAAYRLKEPGMVKFREWQHVWDLQRREDAGETVSIPVPPKYAPTDFRSTPAWRARGKLDVPKERFIAYPGLARAGDSWPVLGWAGWDHADQALALARAVGDMRGLGAADEVVEPLLAGLAELEPWLHQWHSEADPARGGSPAAAITAMLEHELSMMGLTRPELEAWRPKAATRGRKAREA
ncbi:MAG: BREX-2 system adenine-specific DNA-methyltransferase PglX [Phycicoccus sp.]|nr:BREX-2 system adenine-specific DNA-methyltransferase PglX [Phycicoccus sp.]